MTRKILIIAVIIALIAGLLYLGSNQERADYSSVDLENSPNTVYNYSSVEFADSLAHLALKSADLDGLKVSIHNLKPGMASSLKTTAFAEQTPLDSVYQIFIDPDRPRFTYVTTFAHEIVHIKQFSENRLKRAGKSSFIFNGDTIEAKNLEHHERPWEIEAFITQRGIRIKIEKEIY